MPNILFMLADDQGWNGLSVAMHPDISEAHDLAADHPDEVAALHARMKTYLEAVDASILVLNPRYDPVAPTTDSKPRRKRGR